MSAALLMNIEMKTYNRFRRAFTTDKYITVVQWEEIQRNIEKRIQRQMKLKVFDKTAIKDEYDEFTVDDSLRVETQLVPKSQSYINFRRIDIDYQFDFVVAVKITRISHPIKESSPDSDPVIKTERSEYEPMSTHVDNSTLSEYDPISNSNEVIASYTASRKRSTENRTSPEYNPSTIGCSSPSTNVSPVSYTPMKIEQNNNYNVESDDDKVAPYYFRNERSKVSSLQEDLFGKESNDDSCEEITLKVNTKSAEENENPSKKKRRLMNLPEAHKEDPEAEKEAPTGSKKKKRIEHKTIGTPKVGRSNERARATSSKSKQQSMDVWVSTEKKSNRPETSDVKDLRRSKLKQLASAKSNAQSPKSMIENPMDAISEEQTSVMNRFEEQYRKKVEKDIQRRIELEDVVILRCEYVMDEDLERMIKDFKPTIESFFEQASKNKKPKKDYNYLFITTSGVLSEKQTLFVLQEIENQRDAGDRGCHEAMLMETILPEFIIRLFCTEFTMTREEAIEQLNNQKERQLLFEKGDADL